MKYILALNLFAFCCLSAFSQSKDSTSLVLGVEKQLQSHTKTFVFKPNNNLKIRTKNGQKFCSDKYSFSDKFILMDMKDTILFENVKWIKGRVYGDKGRKIAGALITTYAGIAGSAAIFGIMVVGGPLVSVAVLTTGTVYGGVRLMGARKFWRMYHWNVIQCSL